MAVEGPNAGVVGLELQDNMSARPQHLCVPTLRIPGVYDRRAVPGTVTLMKDLEIMSVQVKWLRVLALCLLYPFLESETYVGNM